MKMILKLNDRGSFLIEVLLTVGILSISLTMIIQSLLSSLNAAVYTSQYSKAIILTENKLFEALSAPSSDPLNEDGVFSKPFEHYKYELKSDPLDDQETFEDVNIVDIQTSWALGGKNRQINVQTYHYNPVKSE